MLLDPLPFSLKSVLGFTESGLSLVSGGLSLSELGGELGDHLKAVALELFSVHSLFLRLCGNLVVSWSVVVVQGLVVVHHF